MARTETRLLGTGRGSLCRDGGRERGTASSWGCGRPRLLYFITEDWFFFSHFLSRARVAVAAGFDVGVVCRVHEHGQAIRREGFNLIPIDIRRGRVSPLRDLRLIWTVVGLYRRLRPDIVHHIAVKPLIYGSIAARLSGVSGIVNAPVGMGFVFSSQRWFAQLLRPFVLGAYRLLLDPPSGYVVLENNDDLDWLTRVRIVRPGRAVLIRGAGVDPAQFRPGKEEQPPMVVMVGRLLWDKGIGEFVAAASWLRQKGSRARFVVIGQSDPDNPGSIPRKQVIAWQEGGVVEFWGQRTDIPDIFSRAALACLPSYREGLPKVLVEAAACGLPIVATDVPGCREVVVEGVNGYLVAPRDPMALARAVNALLAQPDLRRRFGQASRRIVIEHFTEEHVDHQTLALYLDIVARTMSER